MQNNVAIVTGGTKGIGLALVKSFLTAGMKVCFTGRSQQSVDQARETLAADPDSLLGIVVDVRDAEGMKDMVDTCVRKWTKIDILIANAGIGHFKPIEEMTYDQWNEVIDVNLTGVFNTIKPAIPAIRLSKGYIITIASLAGTNFFAQGTAYNASKFGLVGFTQSMMLDLRKYGIKVSTIMPGSVATHFNNHVPSPEDDWKIQPQDIAQVTMDLLKMPGNSLPSKVEIRPSMPPSK